jgi:GTP-binding protein
MDVTFLVSAFRPNQYPPPDRPEIAFAGRSNVGKSSLINVFLNRKKLAKTSSTPGRTQSINFFAVDALFYVVDLPGYGFARVPLEVRAEWGKMVEAYLRSRSNLKVVVVIIDIRRGPGNADLELLRFLEHFGKKAVVVLTKADKMSRQQCRSKMKEIRDSLADSHVEGPILFSAKTREGREEVWTKALESMGIEMCQGRMP